MSKFSQFHIVSCLLNVHHEAAIAGNADHGRVRLGHLGADGGGQAIAHRAQAAAGEMRLRAGKAAVLRHPHLVLTDIAGNGETSGA